MNVKQFCSFSSILGQETSDCLDAKCSTVSPNSACQLFGDKKVVCRGGGVVGTFHCKQLPLQHRMVL